MSINWITVAAQIINFLILVWLLKRFLYRPILDGIDARERGIAERMAEATHIREDAETAGADHRAEIARLKAGREGVIEEAREEAKAARDTLLAEARERLTREQAAQREERAEEARRYSTDLNHKGASAILSLTRKALNDLSGEALEERIVTRASSRMASMMDDLHNAAGESRVTVVTTRETLTQALRERLESQITAVLPESEVRFCVDPDQSPGLGLRLGGAQLGWTVDTYIDGLQEILDENWQKERANAA